LTVILVLGRGNIQRTGNVGQANSLLRKKKQSAPQRITSDSSEASMPLKPDSVNKRHQQTTRALTSGDISIKALLSFKILRRTVRATEGGVMERIGFIGLGAMGKPMARNLLKAGFTVNVLTRTRSKIDDLLAVGALWCDTPKEIAQKSDVVITMLPDTPDVEQVVAGTREC
jgi:hypothetical protein